MYAICLCDAFWAALDFVCVANVTHVREYSRIDCEIFVYMYAFVTYTRYLNL